MLVGLDHVGIGVADVAKAIADYATVLGRQPSGDRLQLDNMALVIERSGEASSSPDGTASLGLVLATDDIAAASRRLARRALPSALEQSAARYDIEPGVTYGVPISVVCARAAGPSDETSDIAGLDHVVVRTPDPERAVALYGGRLGLDLRLDRSNPDYGSRLLFFVCGGLVIEIAHDLKAGVGAGPDSVRGLAWRARDIDRAHTRMQASGVVVSELRTGRRPGTRVFTVKSHTAGVPTLVIGGEGLERS